MAYAPERGCREATGVEKSFLVDYKAEFSNLEFRLGMMRIQRFIDLYLSKMVRGVDSILQLSR